MKATIVILNWNGKEMMRNYLPSVLKNSNMSGVQVVVADNGSSDGSVDMLKSEFSEVPVIVLDKNYGFAEGYNRAFEQVDSDYYVLLNSDVEIRDENWLLPIIDFMDDNPDVAACQPKILSLNNPHYFEYAGAAGGFIDKYGYPFCRGRLLNKVEQDVNQYDDIMDVMWASGAALVIRSRDYKRVGGLDASFFAHMEEIDLCWRLRIYGKRIVCIPDTKVYHLGGASLSQGNPKKTFLNFRNNLIMLYKNLKEDELKHVMRIRGWLDALAAFSFLMKFDIANFKAVLRARKEFKKLKPSLYSIRDCIQNNRVGNNRSDDRYMFSILTQYYLKQHKIFSQLPLNSKK